MTPWLLINNKVCLKISNELYYDTSRNVLVSFAATATAVAVNIEVLDILVERYYVTDQLGNRFGTIPFKKLGYWQWFIGSDNNIYLKTTLGCYDAVRDEYVYVSGGRVKPCWLEQIIWREREHENRNSKQGSSKI